MTNEPQDQGPEGLSELATEIAGRIARDFSEGETGAEPLAARPKCPPGKLCCSKGYRCSDFWCEGGFRCINDFKGYRVLR